MINLEDAILESLEDLGIIVDEKTMDLRTTQKGINFIADVKSPIFFKKDFAYDMEVYSENMSYKDYICKFNINFQMDYEDLSGRGQKSFHLLNIVYDVMKDKVLSIITI